MFNSYEALYDQPVNKLKSAIFPLSSISSKEEYFVLAATGLQEARFPLTYLGASIHNGRLTPAVLEPLVNNIKKKLATWKSRLLSNGGRLV